MVRCASLSDVIHDMESGIYNFTKNGACSNCGSCCSDLLPVSSHEIKNIKRYIRKNGIQEQRHFLPTAERIGWDLTCPFRDNVNGKCVIYSVRPMICREFKCDYPAKEIQLNRDKMIGKYDVRSMRKTFFEEESQDE